MKIRNKNIITSLIIIAILFLSGIAVYAKFNQFWSASLDQNFGLDSVNTTPTPIQNPSLVDETTPIALSTPNVAEGRSSSLAQAIPADVSRTRTYCGGPPLMYVLGIGADSGIDYYYGLADIIRIARVDFVTPKVTVLSLPRDLWVEIPDIQHKYGITHGKLNQAFLYGGPGMGYYDGPDGGPGLLSRTINYNFGIQVDHYGAINMQTFVRVVNALGGIDVVLPYAVNGREDGRGYYYAGKNHLNGEQALNLARIRNRYNDFIRQDHQTLVINAILAKFKDIRIFLKIPNLIGAFQGSVLTDLSLREISQIICLYPKLEEQNIVFTQLPNDILISSSVYSPQQKDITYIIKIDFKTVRQYLDQFEAGTWP